MTKLDPNIVLNIFSEIRTKMRIPPNLYTGYGKSNVKFNTSWEDSLRAGISIKSGDKDFSVNEYGELIYKGVKVLLYIQDQSVYSITDAEISSYKSAYKFHIAFCSTLQSMMEQGKYEKYVVSTRDDGLFAIRVYNGHRRKDFIQELKICRNCLQKLNYKKYKNVGKTTKDSIYEHFKLKEFFAVHNGDYRFMGVVPSRTDRTSKVDEYSKDWDKISFEYKTRRNWICEGCGKDYNAQHELLHVHHRNGIKSDNAIYNLQALCVYCHKKLHPHMHI